jgi:hypothetical protein
MLIVTPLDHGVFLKHKFKIPIIYVQYRGFIVRIVDWSTAGHLQATSERAVIDLLFDGNLKCALYSLAVLPSILRPFAPVQKLRDGAFHGIEKLRRRYYLLRYEHIDGCIELLRVHSSNQT